MESNQKTTLSRIISLMKSSEIKYRENIQSNLDHLKSLKGKNSSEWREYATKCMIEIMDNKK